MYSIRKQILPLLFIFALTTACQMQENASFADNAVAKFAQVDLEDAPSAPTALTTQSQLKLIRSAEIRMEVAVHDEAARTIRALVNRSGGFISDERSSGDNNFRETTLEIRIPNTEFDSLTDRIPRLGTRLAYKNITSQDVSEEFVDLQARIKSKKASEETYQNILRSSKKIEDVLNVQSHLREIREEIEAAEGRLRYLADQVSLSTVTVSFYENQPIAAANEAGDGFGTRVKVALLRGWQGIQTGLVGLAYIWPFLLLVTGLIFLRKRIFPFLRRNKSQV